MRHFIPVALVATLALVPASAQEVPGPLRHIAVTGAAEVEAPPDLATVTAGVETRSDTAADALSGNSAAMEEVFAALAASGIAPRDMQTSNLSLGAVWDSQRDGSEPQVIGYQASNMVTVRVRDVAALGAVIDAVTTAGANRLYGVSFEIAEPRVVMDDARTRAIADARARAELYAGAAGVTLGQVMTISEATAPSQPFYARAAESMDAAPPVAGGAVSLRAEVSVVFALE